MSQRRVLAAINETVVPDAPTSSVLAATLRAHGSVLSTLGDHDAADLVMERLGELSARDPFAGKLALPYALKGLKRAVIKRPPARAR